MSVRLVAVVVGLLCSVPYAWASEVVEAPIRTVSMFKNGLAVITREIEVDGPGIYVLEHAPTAVHGTFWVESDAVLTTRTISRRVEVPLDPSAGQNLREELTGRTVTVRTDDDDLVYRGRVVALTPGADDQQWSRSYEAIQRYWWSYPTRNTNTRATQTRSGAMILDSNGERHYIMPDRIKSVTVHDPTDTMMRMQPVLEFTVEESDGREFRSDSTRTITLTYLTKGITWAPAYLTRLGEDGELELVQQATIRNEMESIDGAEFFLISGFPNIEFSHVDGLNSPAATISAFFSQLNQRVASGQTRQASVTSQVAFISNLQPGGQDSPINLGELADAGSSDLHYQSIGTLGLEAGASVVMNIASGRSDYKRVVEWKIADTRDVHGRPIQEYNRNTGQSEAPQPNDPWDAARFRNPLDFPMTTAPMMVLNGRNFAGQSLSYWTNPGDMTTARLTKALSVRADHVELEREGARRDTRRHHWRGWIATVDVEMRVVNHRATPIDLEIRREFSGDLIDSDLEPASNRLLESGTHSFNPRRELTWTIPMAPREERIVKFSYEVFVRR